MKYIDSTLPTPAANVACDNALLDLAEEGESGEALRFWESPVLFVVAGFSRSIDADVKIPYCRTHGIPIVRRCTGGGTVIQGPGCLSYALVLDMKRAPALKTIEATNRHIMGRIRRALTPLVDMPIEVTGDTDLSLSGMKISGNAQRRGNRFLLFHGTFLLGFDITVMHKLLTIPEKQPAYRNGRPHVSFVRNMLLDAGRVRAAMAEEWNAAKEETNEPGGGSGMLPRNVLERIDRLVETRYGSDKWNLKR